MDNIKYQVFISSTYKDLVEERKQVLSILLQADCIPAGMENFTATDDEQFNVIKKVIDLCDYYVLIIGRRYGSINDSTGKSYTEMEYEYAMEQGIPVLVFAIDQNGTAKEELEDDIKRGKLAEFRERALSNRLASVWKTQADLAGQVALSIMKAKAEIKRPGWHRGEDGEKAHMRREIELLHKQIDELQSVTESKEMVSTINLDKKVLLHYTEQRLIFGDDDIPMQQQNIQATLGEIFKFVSLRITGTRKFDDFMEAMEAYLGKSSYVINCQDALLVKNNFEQMQLLESFDGKDEEERIRLTDQGKKLMNQMNQ